MPISTPEDDLRPLIRKRAAELGFDVARFTRAEAPADAGAHLAQFVAESRHGDMDWLARNTERRASPDALWPGARSVVVLGMNYGPSPGTAAVPAACRPEAGGPRRNGAISVYAQGDDYHDVIKAKLKQLAEFIAGKFAAEVKVFVDTAPVMEKPLAQEAGLGWQGKHTNLVSREFGSWLFLGSIFTTLELESDVPEADHCGTCRRCLDACPTQAFTAPYRIDARRCISYLTIEHKGHIAREFRAAMGNRIYGCDDCLAVCPWNTFASQAREARFHARAEFVEPALAELSQLDDAAFRHLFRKSPIKRIGRDRFIRNVLIAIGNSGDAGLADHPRRLLSDPSPLVRAMAVWALGRLLDREGFAALRRNYFPGECDTNVQNEWSRGAAENAE
ncbi:MAG TPA: tRNA epoxyqueuosine(34) reductase QueG [Rhizomicrobium sp.]|jgi:epoxyqueuosine reductase|nr:tRNA epoxyqueuosine(34) reductase QueG [Rhizomicrobium sp.]